jgi:predicted dinucleotide-binding enzyme
MLPGGGGEGTAALSKLGREYPKARLALCGFGPAGKNLAKRLAEAGIDAAHINIVSQSRTTAQDAHYSAALTPTKTQ